MKRFVSQRMVAAVGTWVPRAAARFYPDILWRVPAASKTAYLTFDDGPNPEHTEQILEILDRHDALASFFLIGARAERHPQLVEQLHAAGHAVGNHSYSHPDPWKTDATAVVDELDRTSSILRDLIGRQVRFYRPPYGHFTRAQRDWCTDNRHRLTMWDIGPGDYLDVMSTEAVAREVSVHLRPGSVVVLHDNPRRAADTPEALDRLLSSLRRDGWTFAALESDS